MSTAEKKTRFTVEEYLAMEEVSGYKNEYYNGEIFAMSGGSSNHSNLTTNLIALLRGRAREKKCRIFDSNLKIWIEEEHSFVYPDLFTICGPLEYYQDRKDIIRNPELIVEVLSPGTSGFDKKGKFYKYQKLTTFKEYLLVEQDKPQVTVWSKDQNGKWQDETWFGFGSRVSIQTLDIQLSMQEIYEDITF